MSADGRVIWVAPFGSSANQTLAARVLLENAERKYSARDVITHYEAYYRQVLGGAAAARA